MMTMANMQKSAVVSKSLGAMRSPMIQPVSNRAKLIVRRTQEKTKGDSGGDLTPQEVKEIGSVTEGDISPRNAELRANLGNAWTDPAQMQAFDGPAPETINGRTAMLGVLIAIIYELRTGLGIKEQIADHPFAVIATFVIIAIATYIPLSKGLTRKEPYENGIWTAQAENWNGRLAMMGFLGMLITEAVSGHNTLVTYGLQNLPQSLGQ